MTTTPQSTSWDRFRAATDLAVLANRFDTIVREMTNTLLRSGRSAILNTARDFSCSIVTADNQLLTAAESIPIHVVGSQFLTEAIGEFHPDPRAGDAYLHNDPYLGNTHHADHTILVPVVFEGEHLFTMCAKAHQADCGNSRPTTYAYYAADIYEEGALCLPCVKVQAGYEDVDDIIRICKRRVRVPEQWYGDYQAAVGAARIGERRILELLAKYGRAVVLDFVERWLRYSEDQMVNALGQLPKGRLHGEARHDPIPGLPEGIPLSVEIDVDPEDARVTVDLRGNEDCVPAGLNLSRACSTASGVIGVLNQLPDEVPRNQGSFRRVEVLIREGSVAGSAPHPICCSVATTNVADRLINLVQATFAQLGEGYGLAEGAVGMGPGFGVISGVDPRTRSPYINQAYFASQGGPGGPREDGWIFYGVPAAGGVMYRDSVEVAELKYPLLIREIRLLTDSEGHGRHRGAPGSLVRYGPMGRNPVKVAYLADGAEAPPRGVLGGSSPVPHQVFKLDSSGVRVDLPLTGEVVVSPGEQIVEIANGGGGYGDPLTRDPQRVAVDVEARFVSAERAEAVYGVVVRNEDGRVSVNESATLEVRSRLRSASLEAGAGAS